MSASSARAAAAAAAAPAAELRLGSASGVRLSSMLDSFAQACSSEDAALAAAPRSWGGKCSFSLFDEEEVLAPGAPTHPDDDDDVGAGSDGSADGVPAAAPAAQEPYHANVRARVGAWNVGGEVQIQMVQVPREVDEEMSLPWLHGVQGAVAEPRLVRRAREACCVARLGRDAEGKCPICLERILQGQVAWTLPCLHQVHHACATRLFGTRGARAVCPLCRCRVEVAAPREGA